jgi:hypothetical protein
MTLIVALEDVQGSQEAVEQPPLHAKADEGEFEDCRSGMMGTIVVDDGR